MGPRYPTVAPFDQATHQPTACCVLQLGPGSSHHAWRGDKEHNQSKSKKWLRKQEKNPELKHVEMILLGSVLGFPLSASFCRTVAQKLDAQGHQSYRSKFGEVPLGALDVLKGQNTDLLHRKVAFGKNIASLFFKNGRTSHQLRKQQGNIQTKRGTMCSFSNGCGSKWPTSPTRPPGLCVTRWMNSTISSSATGATESSGKPTTPKKRSLFDEVSLRWGTVGCLAIPISTAIWISPVETVEVFSPCCRSTKVALHSWALRFSSTLSLGQGSKDL